MQAVSGDSWRQRWRMAWLLTLRDARAGELSTLLIALVLAVAALTSVAFVADRMHAGLQREARQMLGGDMRIRSDHPVDPAWSAAATARGLRTADTAEFPSMATLPAVTPAASTSVSPDSSSDSSASADTADTVADAAMAATRLVAVKAVSSTYPLRGAVTLADRVGGPSRTATAGPAAGTVWVDPGVLDALGLHPGDALQLGTRALRIAAVIVREPDRGFSFIDFSPRVMMAQADLPSTGLIGLGSRVTYRVLVAAPNADDSGAVDTFAAWLHGQIDGAHLRGVSVETLANGQPQVRQTLERADRFLRLVALLTSLLSAVAIALAAQRFARRHVDGCAVMRCLGASEPMLRSVFLIELTLLAVSGAVVGAVLGLIGHAVLLHWLAGLLRVDLPWPSLWPMAQGGVAAVVLLLGFGLPAFFPLTRVSPVRVLRRAGTDGEPDDPQMQRARWSSRIGYAIGMVCYIGLLIWAAGSWRLGGVVALGFAAGVAVFAILGRALLRLLAYASKRGAGNRDGSSVSGIGSGNGSNDRGHTRGAPADDGRRAGVRFGWRYAIASLERRGAGSTLQITALGVALMCLLLLSLTRSDLVDGWRQSTPADAPNRFLIDIQPDQATPVAQALTRAGIDATPPAPMIRGRLTERNGHAVTPNEYADTRVKRLVDREFNLSYTTALPSDNRITEGQWYGAIGPQGGNDHPAPQISIEAGLAHDLGVKLGDRLTFDVAGQTITAPVTSLRKLDWGTMRVNFFVLMPPDALRDFPATFITSFHAEPRNQPRLDALVHDMPNVTVIDTAALMAQIQQMLDQVVSAVQFLFAFTLAAGAVVLYAALAGTRDERAHESALLRALGASHRQVRAVQWTEFAVVGLVAGALAAIGAQAVGAALALRVFNFAFTPDPMMLVEGMAIGLVCAAAGGWWSLRSVLRRPVLQTLRAE